MQAAMDGRDFRNFMEAFLRFASNSWGRAFNYAWSLGMFIGPIVALVFLWDDPGRRPRSPSGAEPELVHPDARRWGRDVVHVPAAQAVLGGAGWRLVRR